MQIYNFSLYLLSRFSHLVQLWLQEGTKINQAMKVFESCLAFFKLNAVNVRAMYDYLESRLCKTII